MRNEFLHSLSLWTLQRVFMDIFEVIGQSRNVLNKNIVSRDHYFTILRARSSAVLWSISLLLVLCLVRHWCLRRTWHRLREILVLDWLIGDLSGRAGAFVGLTVQSRREIIRWHRAIPFVWKRVMLRVSETAAFIYWRVARLVRFLGHTEIFLATCVGDFTVRSRAVLLEQGKFLVWFWGVQEARPGARVQSTLRACVLLLLIQKRLGFAWNGICAFFCGAFIRQDFVCVEDLIYDFVEWFVTRHKFIV